MSDETLEDLFLKKDLVKYAEHFGVEFSKTDNKSTIAEAMGNDGIDLELIKTTFPQDFEDAEEDEFEQVDAKDTNTITSDQFLETDDEPKSEQVKRSRKPVVRDDDLLLMKMTRSNIYYEIRGYKFTREAPYALVKEDDVDYLIEVEGGFQLATPREVREFYN